MIGRTLTCPLGSDATELIANVKRRREPPRLVRYPRLNLKNAGSRLGVATKGRSFVRALLTFPFTGSSTTMGQPFLQSFFASGLKMATTAINATTNATKH